MVAYRIAKRAYIEDLSGEGARLHGGRWNRKGTAVLYGAESRALATVEYLVHIPLSLLPTDLFIAEISLPRKAEIEEVPSNSLPANWATYPPPSVLTEIGQEWIMRNESLVLRLPSAVVRGEFNLLINPKHEHAKDIEIVSIEPMAIDERLVR